MKSSYGKILFKLLLLFVCVTAVGVSQAHAVDGKIYTGSSCVRWSGTTSPIYNFSAIGNPADSWLYVDCPVIHDSINASINSGWVKVIDQNYTYNARCNLNSIYRNGGSWWGWWTPNQSSAGSSSSPQTLSFGGIGSNSISHYYYSCRIPPIYSGNRSYLISYKVDEN